MLASGELGAFILVLANSLQDDGLNSLLAPQLQGLFQELLARREMNALDGGADDLAVFAALAETGIAGYACWQSRSPGRWRCSWNPLRALRPARASAESFGGLRQPFNEQGFHFDKPFLKPEILNEETFEGRPLRIMFQKFPFVAYHLLILPDAAAHRSQWLDEASHELIWNLTAAVAGNIPGFGAAYNSLGAGASVNHLHFHGYVQPERFAIERENWVHNGGDEAYPVSVTRHVSPGDAWRAIDALHRVDQPYNLLYRAGCCYVIRRAPLGLCDLPGWTETVGWQEMAGAFNLSDKREFEQLAARDIEKLLAGFRP